MSTVTHQFKVKEVTEDGLSLTVTDSGTSMYVQRKRVLYGSDLWDKIQTIEKGDIVTLTLEGRKSDTMWQITEIGEFHN